MNEITSKKTPFFSIIVPVYNTADYIHKCLSSLLNQLGNVKFEVIIVDDGSSDHSADICQFYCGQNDSYYYFYKDNGGLGSARNVGIKNATGNYLLFLDSDDYFEKNAILTLYESVINNNYPDVIEFRFARVNEEFETLYESKYHPSPNVFSIISCESNSSACLKCYKKNLFLDIPIFFTENRLYEDLSTIYKLYLHAKNIISLDLVLYFYVRRAHSITSIMKEKNVVDLHFSAVSTLSYLADNNLLNTSFECDYSRSIQLRFIRLTIICLKGLWIDINLFDSIMPVVRNLHKYYSDSDNMALLKKVNKIILQDYVENVVFVEEKLSMEKKKNAFFSTEEYLSINNISLSRQFGKLASFIYAMKHKYQKIAIYGNGVISGFVSPILGEKLSVIFDMSPPNNTCDSNHNYLQVEHVDKIDSANFDVIFISVFGREKEIQDFLINIKNVNPDKILVFKENDIN